jgi:hypothetical protein
LWERLSSLDDRGWKAAPTKTELQRESTPLEEKEANWMR